jgi:hypothetical protein
LAGLPNEAGRNVAYLAVCQSATGSLSPEMEQMKNRNLFAAQPSYACTMWCRWLVLATISIAAHMLLSSSLAAQQQEIDTAALYRCEAQLRTALADTARVRRLMPVHIQRQRTVVIDGRLASSEELAELDAMSPVLAGHRVASITRIGPVTAKRMEEEAGRPLGGRISCIEMRRPAGHSAGTWQR